MDTERSRLDLAESLGATPIEMEPPKRYGSYPITVDASGRAPGLSCALLSTEPEGVCTSIGIYFSETTPVPLLEMYTRGITFKTGRVHARAVLPEVLELARAAKIHPQRVTGQVIDWADAAAVLSHHSVKTVVTRAA